MKNYELLKSIIRRRSRPTGKAAVAYSGGADSALLLAAAADALSPSKVIAVIGDSETYPAAEKRKAVALAKKIGSKVVVVKTREIDSPSFSGNPPDRCFHCKNELFRRVTATSRRFGAAVVFHGATLSDDGDFRPGAKAAAAWKVAAPLREAGFTKADVRLVSRALGLSTASKPSQACLASRLPYGETITPEKLSLVEKSEAFLQKLGFREVRVRFHPSGAMGGRVARIELGSGELSRALRKRKDITRRLKKLGFTYVSLDLDGFQTGSQNLIFRRRP
ncbi:MAG: TIGR00268 family protein [Elusimicrobia bacterium HGW-Elusimicrobia-1]|jgi:uncharacterized protein|nr:MAG: TIGR00268 family protein [Elusimicrobia bacterium HGW-Elusimicrobia-1]